VKGEIMTEASNEDGVILALIDRFEKQGLPRLQALKENTDNGERLSNEDVAFLDTVIHDAQQSWAFNRPTSRMANVLCKCSTPLRNHHKKGTG
jgi:hypothetical protein